jgi:group I intron endonuclease
MQNNNNFLNNNESFVPIKIYNNAEIDKLMILKDNKNQAGIYKWTHLESGKIYIGSAVDLSLRLRDYFNKSFLNRNKNMYIYNALLHHGYSAFSLSIIEYINISNLNVKEAGKLILEREQYYLDTLQPEYNILKIAGNSLGYKHSKEALAKMSEAVKGEKNPMSGKNHTFETRVLMSKNHSRYMLGRTHSSETILKMIKARTAEKNPNFGKYKKVFVYSFDSVSNEKTLYKSFDKSLEVALYFNCTRRTISRYLDKNKLFKKQWILSTFELN